MKKSMTLMLVFLGLFSLTGNTQESKTSLTTGADVVSSYVWRGTKFGRGPAIQPTVEFKAGGFALGAWGSYCMSDSEAAETDLYASCSFDFGLSLGATGYYFPGSGFFDPETHAFELNGGWEAGNFSVSANYILNEGAGSAGGDTYLELGYQAGNASFFAGAGNGWYTPDQEFSLCNVGVTASGEIKITDRFSLPVSGSVILNPKTEQMFIVFGITL